MQVVAAINTIELNTDEVEDYNFDEKFKRPSLRNLDIFDFLQYTFGFQVLISFLLNSSLLINFLGQVSFKGI